MASYEQLIEWAGSGKQAAQVLALDSARTLRNQSMKLGMPGKYKRDRYKLVDLIRSRIGSLLWTRGFKADGIKTILADGCGLAWMLEQLRADDSALFVLAPHEEEVKLWRIRADQLETVTKLFDNHIFVILDVAAIVHDVMARLSAYIDGVPFVSVGDRARQGLMDAIAKRKQETEPDDEDREAAAMQSVQ